MFLGEKRYKLGSFCIILFVLRMSYCVCRIALLNIRLRSFWAFGKLGSFFCGFLGVTPVSDDLGLGSHDMLS